MHLGLSTDNVAFAQFAHYEPYMAVDIADLADPEPDLAETLHGEAMDVNAEMFACGWYEDSGGFSQPFFLDPRDGGDAYILPLSTYEFGAALALSESEDYDITGIIVVGCVQDYPAGDKLAAYWEHNGTTWELNLVPDLTSGYDSYATDVGPDGDYAVGYEETGGGVPYPFIFDRVQESSSVKAFIATAMGIDKQTEVMTGTRYNGGDEVAYHYVLGGQSPTDLPNPDDQYYEETYGMAVNAYDDVVGSALDTGTGTEHGVLWYYDDPNWTAHVLDSDNPDPVESTLTDVADRPDGSVDIVGTYMSGGAFYVTVNSSGSYKSYSLDAVTSGGLAHQSFVLFPLRIRQEVEDNSWTPESVSANGINLIGTIAGSYWDGAPSDDSIRPCLFVANDVNNNGEPDLREILQGRLANPVEEFDENSNWMLDWAENDQSPNEVKLENMRCGLHAPGIDGSTSTGTHMHAVDNVQIVRLPADLDDINVGDIDIDADHYSIENIVNGAAYQGPSSSLCDDYYDWIREWATIDESGSAQQREIIVTVRNPHPDDSGYDEVLTPATWDDELAIIRTFAFRFADCIDYMQFGNESVKGAGEWATYHNSVLKPLFCLESTDFTRLLDDGVEWTRAQVEAARIGSALRGRPLRMIAPGFPQGIINLAGIESGDPDGSLTNCQVQGCDIDDLIENCTQHTANKSARGMRDIAEIVLLDRMYFDVHMHYKDVDSAYDALDYMVDNTLDAWGTNAEFMPETKVVLEFGPRGDADDDQWTRISGDMNEFLTGGTPSFSKWDQLIKDDDQNPQLAGWEKVQFEDATYGNGFDMSDLIAVIDGDSYAVVCYGPSDQSLIGGATYKIAALRASQVDSSSWICDTSHYFSPVLRYVTGWNTCTGLTAGSDNYESIINSYEISSFEPHCQNGENECDGCDKGIACPGS